MRIPGRPRQYRTVEFTTRMLPDRREIMCRETSRLAHTQEVRLVLMVL